MTPFRFAHTFTGNPDHYWQLFFDEASTRRQYDTVGVKEFEIVELVERDGILTRTIRVTPARDLPAVIRKVTGATLGYTDTTVFDRAAGTATTVVVPSTLSGRIDVRGTHTLVDKGDNQFERLFEGAIDVRVPLVGRKIENLVLADMTESYKTGAKITQAGIDRLAAE